MNLTTHELALVIGLSLALVGVAVVVVRFIQKWWDERHGKGGEDEN